MALIKSLFFTPLKPIGLLARLSGIIVGPKKLEISQKRHFLR
jgi:hypothetical protein